MYPSQFIYSNCVTQPTGGAVSSYTLQLHFTYPGFAAMIESYILVAFCITKIMFKICMYILYTNFNLIHETKFHGYLLNDTTAGLAYVQTVCYLLGDAFLSV